MARAGAVALVFAAIVAAWTCGSPTDAKTTNYQLVLHVDSAASIITGDTTYGAQGPNLSGTLSIVGTAASAVLDGQSWTGSVSSNVGSLTIFLSTTYCSSWRLEAVTVGDSLRGTWSESSETTESVAGHACGDFLSSRNGTFTAVRTP